MSVETDFRALLAGNASVTALVGTRIALNAVPEDAALPLVVYAVSHDRTVGLDGTLLAEQCSVAVQCWADTATAADAVADAVVAAIATAAAGQAAVLARSTTFDPEMGLDGTELTVEWWG